MSAASGPLLGLALFAVALVLMSCSGWASYAVLLGVGALGVLAGSAFGVFDLVLLGSLAPRVVGLLEHDLLQALALYALVGALLQRLGLAAGLHDGLVARLGGRRAIEPMVLLGLGALTSPLNGSVGASVQALAQAAPGHAAGSSAQAGHAARVAVAATLGVIVPPSLVLLLLGDAMLRAHTEGLNLARQLGLPLADAGLRIVNTQDVLQAVLLPGAAVLVGWMAVAVQAARRVHSAASPADSPLRLQGASRPVLLLLPLGIVLLLVTVASGRMRAVEAAATAGVVLLAGAAVTGRLRGPVLRQVLDDALALTGALFVLLVAATTFSLVLRGLGTDRLVSQWMLALGGGEAGAAVGDATAVLAVVLLALLGASFVLDAFEVIFLVVPIVMPPLLAQVGDAAWVAALSLLVLQVGFLLPPFGYAVVLTSAAVRPRAPMWAMARALAPFIVWSLVVTAAVWALPETTRWARSTPPLLQPPATPVDLDRALREMAPPPRQSVTP